MYQHEIYRLNKVPVTYTNIVNMQNLVEMKITPITQCQWKFVQSCFYSQMRRVNKRRSAKKSCHVSAKSDSEYKFSKDTTPMANRLNTRRSCVSFPQWDTSYLCIRTNISVYNATYFDKKLGYKLPNIV